MAASAASASPAKSEEEEGTLQQELSSPILLADRVIKLAQEAESTRTECSDLAIQTDRLSHLLRSTVRLASSNQSLYERPVRRIVSEVTKNLEKALTLVKKCKKHGSGVLRQVFAITTTADFRKVQSLLDSSIGDMKWLLSIFESDEANLAIPPIASNDPILAWVWSYIATLHIGQLKERADAANELGSLARDNERNKKMIVDEGGIQPLLRLLKEGGLPDAQIAAAYALSNIGTDRARVQIIVSEHGIPIIVRALADSPMRVQISMANLVAKMAELDNVAQEAFARENVMKPLISFLSMNTILDDPKIQDIPSLIQKKNELGGKPRLLNNYSNLNSSFSSHSDGSSRGGHHKKDREVESPEMKLRLRVSCAGALWMLCRESLVNSRKITETKWLLCLAKIIKAEKDELQINCLMTVMEVAAVAELNPDLRRAAFKTNSPAANAILEQLLRILQEESDPRLLIPAIRYIGSLARTFPTRETRIIKPLVTKLGQRDSDVAVAAAIALGKFACPDNFNHLEHSKAIIEFDGVPPLMRLLKSGDQGQLHGLTLLCYLAIHVGNSSALEQVRALNVLETSARPVLSQHHGLREIYTKAIHQLTLYQAGGHPHRSSHAV
ncbi:hypothetical protein SAY87_003229 [Trapa incisa]|uniref:DUF7792 domain-containing protein n=1 Tax=Trapa incisa TaxID=236973 RepID=A0AAN7KFE9_9MYRT|nr:hypothetical protein SAY87_003229 [Trapa incisa]